MGQVIAVANQKGGVGKTTTAVNLSASIAASEKSCLLIDCDPQGNATTGLGVNIAELESGLYDFILSPDTGGDVIMETEISCLHLMGATAGLIGAEVEMFVLDEREYLLKKRLSSLKKKYDYVLLDCPPSLNFLTINAMTASDWVLVTLQCEYYALEGLTELMKTISAVKKKLNPSLELGGIVFTMHDKRNNLSAQVVEEVRKHFKDIAFNTIIPRNVRLSEAPSYGKPILLYDIESKGAQKYLELATELFARGGNHD